MTKCRDCDYYKRNANWQGICMIELPVWLRSVVPPITSRCVGANDGCDLGKEKDCAEFQSDVQAAAGGLSQTPL